MASICPIINVHEGTFNKLLSEHTVVPAVVYSGRLLGCCFGYNLTCFCRSNMCNKHCCVCLDLQL